MVLLYAWCPIARLCVPVDIDWNCDWVLMTGRYHYAADIVLAVVLLRSPAFIPWQDPHLMADREDTYT